MLFIVSSWYLMHNVKKKKKLNHTVKWIVSLYYWRNSHTICFPMQHTCDAAEFAQKKVSEAVQCCCQPFRTALFVPIMRLVKYKYREECEGYCERKRKAYLRLCSAVSLMLTPVADRPTAVCSTHPPATSILITMPEITLWPLLQMACVFILLEKVESVLTPLGFRHGNKPWQRQARRSF